MGIGIGTFIVTFLLVIYHNYRTSELKTQLKHARESIEYIRDSETRFVERCTKAEEALKFYANKENHELQSDYVFDRWEVGDSKVDLDEGAIAREALGVTENEL